MIQHASLMPCDQKYVAKFLNYSYYLLTQELITKNLSNHRQVVH